MPKTPLNFDTVRDLALELADVETGTAYGAPALKVRGNVLASVPVNASAEENSAVFRVDFDMRSSLLQTRPDIYYVTPHYAGYPTVLVRLSKISRAELRELLGLSWSFVSAKRPASRPARARPHKKRRR
jgi:hypothetical protein